MYLRAEAPAVRRRLARLGEGRFSERLAKYDASLWSSNPDVRRTIGRRLGWLDAPGRMLAEVGRLRAFARQVRDDGIGHVVLLGMGGSSLCAEVFRVVFGAAPGHPDLTVLDTTVAACVRAVEERLDLSRTLFLVGSKSGNTTETLSLQAYFWGRMLRLRGRRTGDHFVAITDPGTPLAGLATQRRFRAAFLNPDDIGGRYSALSFFGLVPAALLGVDIEVLLGRAVALKRACDPGVAPSDNPGLALGAAIGELARRGRDKLELVVDAGLQPYGLWLEQLIAESTGKQGRGLIPIEGLGPGDGASLLAGDDRVIAAITLESAAGRRGSGAAIERIAAAPAGSPLGRTPLIHLLLRDRLDLGASMMQWEIATAVAGSVLGVNPFDEPNVSEAKDQTAVLLKGNGRQRDGSPPPTTAKTPASTLRRAIGAWARDRRPGDYVAILAWVDPLHAGRRRTLQAIRARLRALTGLPVTLGYGPRYLHSTGQLHKGGPNSGLFLLAAPDDPTPLPIPGRPYSLEELKQAQALGDAQVLRRHGRRLLYLRHAGPAAGALKLIASALSGLRAPAAGRRRCRRAPSAGRGA